MGNTVLWRPADDLAPPEPGPCREPEAYPALDAADGTDADLPEAEHPSPGNTCAACVRGSKPAKGHKTYPYLLGGLRVE